MKAGAPGAPLGASGPTTAVSAVPSVSTCRGRVVVGIHPRYARWPEAGGFADAAGGTPLRLCPCAVVGELEYACCRQRRSTAQRPGRRSLPGQAHLQLHQPGALQHVQRGALLDERGLLGGVAQRPPRLRLDLRHRPGAWWGSPPGRCSGGMQRRAGACARRTLQLDRCLAAARQCRRPETRQPAGRVIVAAMLLVERGRLGTPRCWCARELQVRPIDSRRPQQK